MRICVVAAGEGRWSDIISALINPELYFQPVSGRGRRRRRGRGRRRRRKKRRRKRRKGEKEGEEEEEKRRMRSATITDSSACRYNNADPYLQWDGPECTKAKSCHSFLPFPLALLEPEYLAQSAGHKTSSTSPFLASIHWWVASQLNT